MSQRAFDGARSAWTTQIVSRSHNVRDVGLRLVGPVGRQAREVPFVVVLLSALAAGLVGLILLSTAMQAQSFTIFDLERETALLEAERAELSTSIDKLQSPSSVAERALSEGMVPNTNPVFLRLQDGKVIGKPVPAEADSNVRRAD